MLKLLWVIFPLITVISPLHNQNGKTPCCIDRLSTIACTRMAQTKKKHFDSQCSNNVDFALVQCCATCFDKREPDGISKYETMVKRLIAISNRNSCVDRRGDKWCKRMINREGFWLGTREFMSCEMFPFAFRECRNSCGFCTTLQTTTILKSCPRYQQYLPPGFLRQQRKNLSLSRDRKSGQVCSCFSQRS